MKVYLASQYCTKDQISKYAAELRENGIEVTSSWLEEPHSPNTQMSELSPEQHTFYALNDLNDVDRSDMLVFFSVDPSIAAKRGGRHVEFGYAIKAGLPILVVGPKENIFHYLPNINHVAEWKNALTYLKEQNEWLKSITLR